MTAGPLLMNMTKNFFRRQNAPNISLFFTLVLQWLGLGLLLAIPQALQFR